MKPDLFVIFPITGPINGVKSITKQILNNFNSEYNIVLIDTGQAKDFKEFGKFTFSKIIEVKNILIKILKIKSKSKVYFNFSVKGYSFLRDFIFLLLLIIKKSNITIHIHANGIETKNYHIVNYFLNKVKIIVINQEQFNNLKHLKRVFLLPNAIKDYYKDALQKPINHKLQILFLSNISIEKGASLLKNFCINLEELKDKIHVTIYGGILDSYSENVIDELSKINYISYKGVIKNEDEKMALFLNSDLFIFLSNTNYEVYPLVYLEALMNGCAILTTKQIISETIVSNSNGQHINTSFNIEYVKILLNKSELAQQQANSRYLYTKISNFDIFCNNLKNIINV